MAMRQVQPLEVALLLDMAYTCIQMPLLVGMGGPPCRPITANIGPPMMILQPTTFLLACSMFSNFLLI